jgi:hypothetical protein
VGRRNSKGDVLVQHDAVRVAAWSSGEIGRPVVSSRARDSAQIVGGSCTIETSARLVSSRRLSELEPSDRSEAHPALDHLAPLLSAGLSRRFRRRWGGATTAGRHMGVPTRRVCIVALCVGAMSVVAGCGSSAPSSSAGPGSGSSASPEASSLAPKHTSRAFLREVNVVCQTVRQGAPQELRRPYEPRSVDRYAAAARGPAERTAVSLQRLAAQGGGHDLRLIASGYVALRGVYSSAPVVARDPSSAARLGQTIELREQAVTAASRSAGVPACGVAGR